MNDWRYIFRSLIGHLPTQAAVMAAIAIATGVLTGALLVGDSVRYSLESLVLDRLGSITHVMVTDRFVQASTIREFSDSLDSPDSMVLPATLLPQVTVEKRISGQASSRTRGAFLVASDDRFWQLQSRSTEEDREPLQSDEAMVNQSLANELELEVGNTITVRVPALDQVHADSALGKKEGRVEGLIGLRVVRILPDSGLARFSLTPTQANTKNVFVHPQVIQDAWDQEYVYNAVLVSLSQDLDAEEGPKVLAETFSPTLEDCGVQLARETMIYQDDSDPVWDYWGLSHRRLVWDRPTRLAVRAGLEGLAYQEVFTYMANTITNLDARDAVTPVPYSTVSALDNHPSLGPLVSPNGETLAPLKTGEIALNEWTANELRAEIGDRIRLSYFEPETTHGETVEANAEFRLAAVVPLTTPAEGPRRGDPAVFQNPPTLANDPHLTPVVEGVTDQEAIDDWDPPFPFDRAKIDSRDDEYWELYRTTPKAFISFEDGQQLWGSRFGTSTGFRIPVNNHGKSLSVAQLRSWIEPQLASRTEELGFRFRPIREEFTKAAQGTTPFEGLFLGFSLFLIASSLMLIGILFRIGIDLRSRELGTLLATGWKSQKVTRIVLAESTLVAAIGASLGIVIAIGYSRLMIWLLTTWWVKAITTPFLHWTATPLSLLVGWAVSILLALGVVALSMRWLRRTPPLVLLKGRTHEVAVNGMAGWRSPNQFTASRPGKRQILAGVTLLAIIGSLAWGTRLQGETQAGVFFGSGALMLAVLLWQRRWFVFQLRKTMGHEQALGPWRLAADTVERSGGRATLTIGLIASASFLLIAIAAFQLSPASSGTGGFQLLAISDRPIYDNLANARERQESFGDKAKMLEGTDILPLRMTEGDDASCRNLYQVQHPQWIGISSELYRYFEANESQFALSVPSAFSQRPWDALKQGIDAVPVILDRNTAMYALHLPAKLGHEFSFEYDGVPVKFRIVGLLANSIFQGKLIVDGERLTRQFPSVSGYRMFLIGDATDTDAVSQLLETRYAEEGLDARGCDAILKDLLAVQNTYLSTFQSLGGLGLLLGTVGLGAVQFRSVLSRIGEIGLYRAVGFSPQRVRSQLTRENLWMLVQGVGMGVFSAAVVVIPHLIFGDAILPWKMTLALIAVILLVGFIAGRVAARIAQRFDTIAALRSDH